MKNDMPGLILSKGYNFILLVIAALMFSGCSNHAIFIPNREVIPNPEGLKLEERISRHWSRRPERVFYVYRDSNDNYVQHGPDTWFFYDGEIKFKENYSYGKKSGLSEFWYQNGHKQGEITYSNGKMTGKALSWHKNGKRHIEKTWIDGVLTGMELRWDKKGTLRAEILWQDNIILDKKFWDKKGRPLVNLSL